MCLQYYHVIEIAIRQCRSSGIDCKVHGLKIRGQLRTEEDEPAIILSYLASDNEDDSVSEDMSTASKNTERLFRRTGLKEILTHVFVWGLNDKDQLGGPRGSKVCCILCIFLTISGCAIINFLLKTCNHININRLVVKEILLIFS